jgi:hypothetical protein
LVFGQRIGLESQKVCHDGLAKDIRVTCKGLSNER